jgi:hypothetical protein
MAKTMAGNRDWLSRLAVLLSAALTGRSRAVLDPRILSEHLQRDMGFLDGNGTTRSA